MLTGLHQHVDVLIVFWRHLCTISNHKQHLQHEKERL